MGTPVRHSRGLRANLPSVGVDGAYYYCTDTHELFIGDGSGMSQVAGGSGAAIDLQSNFADNGNQTKLNLYSNGSVVITDDGAGNIDLEIAANSGIPSAVGQNLYPAPPLSSSYGGAGTFRNKTLWIYIPQTAIINPAGFPNIGFGVRILIKSGTVKCSKVKMFATSANGLVVSNQVEVLFPSFAHGFTVTGPANVQSNSMASFPISNNNDWYLAFYFADDVANDSAQIGKSASPNYFTPVAWQAGDGTGGASVNGGSAVTDTTAMYLVPFVETV